MRTLKYQIGIIMCKPAVRVKIAAITLMFVLAVWEELITFSSIAEPMGGGLTVAVFTMSLFNYYAFFHSVPLFGFIILLPDIVEDAYLPQHLTMANGSRGGAARAALMRIGAATVLYVLWFVLITVAFSGLWLRDFSLGWPDLMGQIYREYGDTMSVVQIPRSATEEFPALAALVLVVLRTTLGFLFLGLLAGLVTLVTKKSKYAVCLVAFLVLWSAFLYMGDMMRFGQFGIWDSGTMSWRWMNAGRFLSVFPLFSFQRLSDDFASWVLWAIVAGAALSVVMAAGIYVYYRKGDIGSEELDA